MNVTVRVDISRYRLEALSRSLRVAHQWQSHTPSSPSVASPRCQRGDRMRRRHLCGGCGRGGSGGSGGAGSSCGGCTTLPWADVQTAGVWRCLVTTHWHVIGARQTAVRISQEGRDFEHQHARCQTQRPREIAAAWIYAGCSESRTKIKLVSNFYRFLKFV